MSGDLLQVQGLCVTFPARRRLLRRRDPPIHAVHQADLSIAAGETLGLVGQSGSGKTTLARAIARLVRPSAGTVTFLGHRLTGAGAPAATLRANLQMVFQDPYSSLNPAMRVADIVGEPLRFHHRMRGRRLRAEVDRLLERVGLQPGDHGDRPRFPHEFSGGQRQRIAIARAIALTPKLVICDEATSGLDVSTRGQIIGLLEDLQTDLNMAYLFIGHDLALVRHVSHRIAVMHDGKIVETGPADQVCEHPAHRYTAALIAAIPVPDPEQQQARRRARAGPT